MNYYLNLNPPTWNYCEAYQANAPYYKDDIQITGDFLKRVQADPNYATYLKPDEEGNLYVVPEVFRRRENYLQVWSPKLKSFVITRESRDLYYGFLLVNVKNFFMQRLANASFKLVGLPLDINSKTLGFLHPLHCEAKEYLKNNATATTHNLDTYCQLFNIPKEELATNLVKVFTDAQTLLLAIEWYLKQKIDYFYSIDQDEKFRSFEQDVEAVSNEDILKLYQAEIQKQAQKTQVENPETQNEKEQVKPSENIK